MSTRTKTRNFELQDVEDVDVLCKPDYTLHSVLLLFYPLLKAHIRHKHYRLPHSLDTRDSCFVFQFHSFLKILFCGECISTEHRYIRSKTTKLHHKSYNSEKIRPRRQIWPSFFTSMAICCIEIQKHYEWKYTFSNIPIKCYCFSARVTLRSPCLQLVFSFPSQPPEPFIYFSFVWKGQFCIIIYLFS